jgi:glucuronate isomerase
LPRSTSAIEYTPPGPAVKRWRALELALRVVFAHNAPQQDRSLAGKGATFMNSALVRELFEAIDALPIVDIHTHVNWKTGTASNIGEILSYHYYTELTNSAEFREGGFPFGDPEALTRIILPKLDLIRNTVQYDWLMTISRAYLGLDPEEWYAENWQYIFERSVEVMGHPDWREEMIVQSNIVRVFLTNQYNDDLEGLDTTFYSPCLRTEPFILWMDRPAEREGLGAFLGRPLRTTTDFAAAIDQTFGKFARHDMGYAAMSIPANFQTFFVAETDAQRLLDKFIGGTPWDESERRVWGAYAINRLCDACRKYGKPYHLMVGVNRDVYAHGVPAGMDLFDSVNSMRGYDYLFNTYPDVRFPTAVLADTTGLELTAAAWIRHNVYPSGHWWYANQPTDIAREVRRRMDTVPGNKIIGYFSDAYYLEFILPKFRMFKFELAVALSERIERSLIHPNMEPFSMEDALDMAEAMLIHNPANIIGIDEI